MIVKYFDQNQPDKLKNVFSVWPIADVYLTSSCTSEVPMLWGRQVPKFQDLGTSSSEIQTKNKVWKINGSTLTPK